MSAGGGEQGSHRGFTDSEKSRYLGIAASLGLAELEHLYLSGGQLFDAAAEPLLVLVPLQLAVWCVRDGDVNGNCRRTTVETDGGSPLLVDGHVARHDNGQADGMGGIAERVVYRPEAQHRLTGHIVGIGTVGQHPTGGLPSLLAQLPRSVFKLLLVHLVIFFRVSWDGASGIGHHTLRTIFFFRLLPAAIALCGGGGQPVIVHTARAVDALGIVAGLARDADTA